MKTYLNTKLNLSPQTYQQSMPLKFKTEIEGIRDQMVSIIMDIEEKKDSGDFTEDLQAKHKLALHQLIDKLEVLVIEMTGYYIPILINFFSHDKTVLRSLESHIEKNYRSNDEYRLSLLYRPLYSEIKNCLRMAGELCSALISFECTLSGDIDILQLSLSDFELDDWEDVYQRMDNLKILITKISYINPDIDDPIENDELKSKLIVEFNHLSQSRLIILASIKLLDDHGFLTKEMIKNIVDMPSYAIEMVVGRAAYFYAQKIEKSMEMLIFQYLGAVISGLQMVHENEHYSLTDSDLVSVIEHYGSDEFILNAEDSSNLFIEYLKQHIEENESLNKKSRFRY